MVHSGWGTEAPCTVYEETFEGPQGNVIPGLYVAWVTLNNPAQFNSYTTEMVKGVIAGFENSSTDRSGCGNSFYWSRTVRLLYRWQH